MRNEAPSSVVKSKVDRETEIWRVKRLNQIEITKAYECPERNYIQRCPFISKARSRSREVMDKGRCAVRAT